MATETFTGIQTSLPDIVLSQLTAEDAKPLFEAGRQNREHINYYGEMVPEASATLDELCHILADETDGMLRFGVWKDKVLLGVARIRFLPETSIVEIGYWIRAEFCRHGFGTATVQGLIDFLASAGSVHYICADTHPDNIASQRVLEKCGFKCNHRERGRLFFSTRITP